MNFDNEKYAQMISGYLVPWAINIIFALAIFIIGKWLAKIIVKMVQRVMVKSKFDDVLVSFLGSILNTGLLLVIIIAALDQLGVDTKSVLAIFAAAGLAIGLALKDSLSNFAAGVMLVVFKPFKLGDFIDAAGVTGTVDMMGIFNTILRTGDNREITVPNAQIYSGVITNFSARDTRRIDLVIGIGYDDDIKAAKQLLDKIMKADTRILAEPEPVILLSELGESSIDFAVRPWVKSGDYWVVRSDLLETIKSEFDSAKISFPYPQRDVHLFQSAE